MTATATVTIDDLDLLHARLDAEPGDQVLRGALADLLEERGEGGLAAGYRALAAWDRVPDMGYDLRFVCNGEVCWWVSFDRAWDNYGPDRSGLPTIWYRADCAAQPQSATRRQAEDWAAGVFGRLPVARQEELLRGPLTERETP